MSLMFVTWMAVSMFSYGEPPKFSAFHFSYDNDVVFEPKNEDRDYTMGVNLSLSGAWFEDKPTHKVLQWIDKHLGVEGYHQRGESRFTVGLNNSAWTPDDLGRVDPIFDDRPYASLLLMTSQKQTQLPSGRVVSSSFSVGVLGLSLSERVQTYIHSNLREEGQTEPQDPMGWRHQISDGGEPTFGYQLSSQKLWASEKNYDISYQYEVNLGYRTNTAAGGKIRWGKIKSSWWHSEPETNGWEFYVWASYQARLNIYDVLLQGQFRHSPVRLSPSEIQNVVHEINCGFVLRHGSFAINYTFAGKTKEERLSDRSHVWGGCSISWYF